MKENRRTTADYLIVALQHLRYCEEHFNNTRTAYMAEYRRSEQSATTVQLRTAMNAADVALRDAYKRVEHRYELLHALRPL